MATSRYDGRPTMTERDRTTSWGAPVKIVYGPGDAPADPPGAPGEFPYTRGIHHTMYRGRLWTMRQYAGFGSGAENNKRYRILLDPGQPGHSGAFHLTPTLWYDPAA